MRRRQCKQSKLAADLDISNATVSRWLSGQDIPNVRSCHKLAECYYHPDIVSVYLQCREDS